MRSLFLLIGLLLTTKITWASEAVSIPVTVKASLCGDAVIEGPEDCEGSDLNDASCESLGFSSGNLSCDSACAFDKTDCVTASPSPSPSPAVASPTTASPATSTTTTTAASPSPASLLTQIVRTIFPKATIPARLSRFDSDASGEIEIFEMATAVQHWIDDWRLVIAGKLADLPQDDLPKPAASKLVALLSGEKVAETGEELKIEAGEVRELEVFTGRVAISEEELERCDLSGDSNCNLIDLSILLYFIAKS